MSQSEAVKSRRSPPAREARVIPIANDRKLGGRRRRFRSKTSFAAAVGKPAWRAVFSYASVALKSLQHFLLNLLDLLPHCTDAIHCPPKPLRFFYDLIDFDEIVSDLRVEFAQCSLLL